MSDTATATPTTAGNIAAAIQGKSNGAPQGGVVDSKVPTAIPAGEKVVPQVGPNAGKEVYVVDGKEIYLTPDQARMYVQKGISFEPKISQLGRLQQETAAFLETLKTDPGKIIFNPQFGSPEQVIEKILNSAQISDKLKETLGNFYYHKILVPEQMTPEQRENAEYKRKAEEYEAMKAQQEEQRLSAENEAKVAKAFNELKAWVSEAMTEGGIPLDSKVAPQMAQRAAQIMRAAQLIGKTVTPKEAIAKAISEVDDYQKAFYDVLDEDKLVEKIGKENAEKVRKFFLKKAKEKEAPKTPALPSAKRDVRKTMTSDEFRDYLDDLKKKS